MPKVSAEFGRAVTEVLLKHGRDGRRASLRSAEIRTELPHSTIHNMSQGVVPNNASKIRQFADGYKERRVPLLEATGVFVATEEDRQWDAERYPHANGSDGAQPERGSVADTLQQEASRKKLIRALLTFGGEVILTTVTDKGSISAGGPESPDDFHAEDIQARTEEVVRYRVNGESMYPPYWHGLVLEFIETCEAETDDYIIARIGNEYVFKQVAKRRRNGIDAYILKPTNDNGQFKEISDEFEIIGKVRQAVLSPAELIRMVDELRKSEVTED